MCCKKDSKKVEAKQKGRFVCRLATPSGNRTRVSPVAGAYSTTRPTVSEAVSPPWFRCRLGQTQGIWTLLTCHVAVDTKLENINGSTRLQRVLASFRRAEADPVTVRHWLGLAPRTGLPDRAIDSCSESGGCRYNAPVICESGVEILQWTWPALAREFRVGLRL